MSCGRVGGRSGTAEGEYEEKVDSAGPSPPPPPPLPPPERGRKGVGTPPPPPPPPPCQRQMPLRPGDSRVMIYLLLSPTYYVVSAGAFGSVLVMFTTALRASAAVFLRLI
ncbi:Hypothetical protein CINCED_3A008149 [Cinara cedri]|uniref:Uncharacterized protein n=1 Tax=Cinara cedri TaxID=506608 RepID=A0A5E4MDF3_9HEMI|nr:Hypothetical protein CINCED_3A008149 [Cinara cedri]